MDNKTRNQGARGKKPEKKNVKETVLADFLGSKLGEFSVWGKRMG